LVGLFITNNQLKCFPDEVGGLTALRKLQAAENKLTHLPHTMTNMKSLELCRFASNELAEVPSVLTHMPRVCWVSLANNPCFRRLDNSNNNDNNGNNNDNNGNNNDNNGNNNDNNGNNNDDNIKRVTLASIHKAEGDMLGAGASGMVYKHEYNGEQV
jgi:hypothetical protein